MLGIFSANQSSLTPLISRATKAPAADDGVANDPFATRPATVS
jgi:hypothetical protein